MIIKDDIIEANDIEEARKKIDSFSKLNKKIIVLGKDIEFNRKILENKKVNMLILNHKQKKDTLRQRDSSLNHILCKIAKKNNVIIAFDFSELERTDKKEKAILLSRWIQNIKLCKKYKVKFKILTNKNKKNIFSFLLTLSCDTKNAKEALN
ncbi:MAG: hypothetical protein QW117_00015 [Candidatus Pacearchaeota archaeon]